MMAGAAVVGLILQALGQDTALHWVLGTVSLLAAMVFTTQLWDKLRHGQYGIDILAPIAIVTAVWLHTYWAAIIVALIKVAATMLARYVEQRLDTAFRAGQQDIDPVAHVLRGTKTVDASAATVRVGDKLIIRMGEIVPVDVTVPDTPFEVRSPHMGTIEPVAGDIIPSGCRNVGLDMSVRALRSGEDSQMQRLAAWNKAAYYSPAPFTRLADRFSVPFAIVALIVAGVMWVISGDTQRFLEVVVVATPFALITGPALVIRSGLQRTYMQGIVIKNASILERLADIDTAAFDKNGVLAAGPPSIAHVTTFDRRSKNDVLAAAASLEQHSSHALAEAIVRHADIKKVPYTKAKHVTEEPGRGLSARVKNQSILVGSYGFLTENEISMPPAFKPASITQTTCFVAIDGALAGLITFDNPVRSDAKKMLEELRNLGVRETLLLTGDHLLVARKLGKQLGFTHVEAEIGTSAKLRALELVEKRPLAYVGSPATEPPVFTIADVGILLGADTSGPAAKTAGVILLSHDLHEVNRAIKAAKRTLNIASQGIIVGAGISLVLIGMFATGKFSAVPGAALQFIVVLAVLANTLRTRRLSV